MNRANLFLISAITLILLSGCGEKEKEQPLLEEPQPVPIAKSQIIPQFFPSAKGAVVSQAAANALGRFVQPSDAEVFTGNLLASVEASDPDGLHLVALSFNQSDSLKYLCEPGDDCPSGIFIKTETNINPADYGVFVGPLTLGLWVMDELGNQMLVDSITLDWQLRRISGASVSRSADGTSLNINWQNTSDLLRYNVLVAAEPGVTLDNYTSLAEGQALLAVQSGPQSVSGLNSAQEYYVMVTGVDGSGESAFSSEFRLAPHSGMVNTPPMVNTETFSSPEDQVISGNLLANDTDQENDQLSLSPLPIKFPLNGDVSLSRDGNFIYQPVANYSGSDSFVYEVQDGQGGIAQGTVNISIDNVNDPPTASPDAFATPANQTLTVEAPGVLGNDLDIDGDALQLNLTPVEEVSNGSLTLMADGGFIYTPNQDFTGADFFIYQISDPLGLTDTARVDISVGQANMPPVAVNDTYSLDEDQTLTVAATASDALLANDSDPEGDPIQLEPDLIDTVDNGVLTIDTQGGFTYIPNANFFGTDSFIYQISDGQGNFAQATATITIHGVNDAPNALDDNFTASAGNTLSVAAPGVLANDTDPDQDNLTVNISPVSAPQNGTLALFADGAFDYTPDSGFTGQDSFTYQISDGNGGTATAQVLLTVQHQQVILGGFSLTTTGSLTMDGVGETSPGSGIGQVRYLLGDCVQTSFTECTLSGTYQENTDSGYDPDSTGSFTMVFTYSGTGPSPVIAQSTEPGGDTVIFSDVGESLFRLALYPSTGGEIIGLFPTGIPSSDMGFSAFLDTSATCTGLAQGQSCSVGQVGLTAGARITGNVGSFNFIIPDPVLNDNVPPIANDDAAVTDEDVSVLIDVLANDSDPDGDALQVIDASVDLGSVFIQSNNQINYVPDNNFFGSAVISYTIYDGNGHTASAQVDVTVNPVNDAPILEPESGLITNSVQAMIIDALANDSDVDQDTLTLIDATTNFGTVTIINNQIYFSGEGVPENTLVRISYTVSDGNGGTSTSFVSIVIGNTWPYVHPDNYVMLPNTNIDVDGSVYALPLTNDTDVNPNDSLSFVQQVLAVQNGVFTDNTGFPSGFSYRANTGFTGIDGGFYEINDGSGNDGEGLFTLQVSDIDWHTTTSRPKVPVLDFLDLTFDGINYALFHNDAVVVDPNTGSGRYYAISGRMVISSADKANWRVEYATNAGNLKAIASGFTLQNPSIDTHIAVGNLGKVLVNQRSEVSNSDWLEVSTGLNVAFNNIQFDGIRFMAVGAQTVAFSANAYTWASAQTANNQEYRDIVFAGGKYVIVGDAGSIETSADRLAWQPQASGTSAQLNAIAYGNGTYVAVGAGGVVLTSSDATGWSAVSSGASANLNQVVWTGSQFVVVGDASTVITSADGVVWTMQTGMDTGNVRSIVSDGTGLLFGSNNGDLFSSTDAVTFIPLHAAAEDMHGIAFDGSSTLVRAGNPSFIHMSSDSGQSWSQLTALGMFNINKVSHLGSRLFIAVGDNGLLMSSPDGSNWTTHDSGTNARLNDVFWFSGQDVQGAPFSLYVVVGDNGTILTSATASVWNQEITETSNTDDLLAVTHDDDYFVAIGRSGRILVRNNTVEPGGTTWMDFFSNASWGNLNDIFFNGSTCVIVGDAGQLVTGTAMTGFTGGSLGTSLNMFSVSGSGNNAIAVGQDGISLYSRDGGGSWHSTVQASEFTLFDVQYHGNSNQFYTVGERGTFLSGTSNIN